MASGTIKAVVSKSDIVNNLATSTAGKVLDASQGKVLKDSIDTLNGQIGQYTNADGELEYITAGDVRTINKSGRYYVRSTVSNLPYTISSYLDVYIYTLDEGGYKRLVARPYNSLSSYECRCVAGVWSEWENQIGNIRYYSFTKSSSAQDDKPWLILKEQFSNIQNGVCIGEIESAGKRSFWGYRNANYASFIVQMYSHLVPTYRVVCSNGSWRYAPTTEGSFESF